MKISGSTILITGGTSGIGIEFAKHFLALGNTVIVTGRDHAKLDAAARTLPGLQTIRSDVTDTHAVADLVEQMTTRFPKLNMLVNNAGIMKGVDVLQPQDNLLDLTQEVETNLNGPIRLASAFLPLLRRQPSAAIVNVTSGIAFLPMPPSPVYSAAKAGLHAWTVTLRMQLQSTNVRVFEVAPPLTATPLGTDTFHPEVIKGIPMMEVERMVAAALKGIAQDKYEIRPGMSNVMKTVSRIAPNWLVANMLGATVDKMRQNAATSQAH
ncbi:MAG: short-chain dehydrogenase/reductase [Devosia sp.]|nr:short-chain dehydrogenase/reductase [Devosia sp.]